MLCWISCQVLFFRFFLYTSFAAGQQPGENGALGNSVLGQSTQPFSTLEKAGCQVASLYQHPNASASYPIPAIRADTVPGPNGKPNVTFSVAIDEKWRFTNVLGTSINAYGPANDTVLEQAMYLDTSSSIKNKTNVMAVLDGGLTGCSFFFSLPLSELGKKDEGDCHSVFDQKCVDDFTQQANSAGLKASANLTSGVLIWEDTCKSLADAMSILPPSCIKFKEKRSKSLGNGIQAFSPLVLTPPLVRQAYSCDNTTYPLEDSPLPTNLFLQSTSWLNTSDYKMYDQWASTVTPILLLYFTNTSTLRVNSAPFASSQLVCSSPSNVQSGSRVAPTPKPSNAAENNMGKFDVTQLVIGALVINAVIFWML